METLHWILLPGIVCAMVAVPLSAQTRGRATPIQIDPTTPIIDLLPSPPKVIPRSGPVLGFDLGKVPEVEFQATPKIDLRAEKASQGGSGGRQVNNELEIEKASQRIVEQIARINHLNSKKQDGFLEALLAERRDLQGLPFAMGDACRLSAERGNEFALSTRFLRNLVRQRIETPEEAADFWESYRVGSARQDARPDSYLNQRDHVLRARMAALMQVMAHESADMGLGLVKHLATTWHPEAVRNLARLAIFSEDEEVSNAAVEALRVRNQETDYVDLLSKGLHYPWPGVAQRTAEVVVKLDRKEMIPELLDVLEREDPRLPRTKIVDGKPTLVTRELVKLNHQRSCLLCHAPATDGKGTPANLIAAILIPGEPRPYYSKSEPNRSVRVDVTYLRQDFSNLQAVAGPNGQESQRFDYLVQTHTLSKEEAALYREKLAIRAPGQKLSLYQEAAQEALRKLTGKNADPNAAAWRKLLHDNAGINQ